MSFCKIVGEFEGTVEGNDWRVYIHSGSNGFFWTIYKNGSFHHKDNWGSDSKTLVQACKDKVEIWKTVVERRGFGFYCVFGKIVETENGAKIVQDMSR